MIINYHMQLRYNIILAMLCSKITSLLRRCSVASFSSHTPKPYTGKSYDQIRELDQKYVHPVFTHFYKTPFLPVQGYKEFLYDQNGKEYIDLFAGISCVNIGHSHPRITKIFKEESAKLLNLSSYYTHPYQGIYAQKLCKQLGSDLDSTFFFNSGSEANDFAYNLAKAHTGNNSVVALRNGYHGTAGNAYNLTSIGTWTTSIPKGNALQRLAWPNFYRNAHNSIDSIIKDAEEQLDSNTNGKIAGVWIEPVMGAGGIIPLAKEYVQRIHKITKRMGGLYISDQVQTGFGRIGKQTWGYKWQQVKPDIVIIAKAIANGTPFSAVITRKQIADSLTHQNFTTFAGGPLECRLGAEVLDILKEQKLPENAETVGTYLLGQFKRIQKKCKYIGDVRGKGMLLAIQFVKDPITKEPNTDLLLHIFEKGRDAGVLFGKGGHKGQLIRMLAPLCISRKSAEKVVGVFEEIIDSLPK